MCLCLCFNLTRLLCSHLRVAQPHHLPPPLAQYSCAAAGQQGWVGGHEVMPLLQLLQGGCDSSGPFQKQRMCHHALTLSQQPVQLVFVHDLPGQGPQKMA